MPEGVGYPSGSKKIGLKRTADGAAGNGTVERISFDEDNKGVAHVTLRHGPKPKRGKHGPVSFPETTNLTVPASMAKGLEVGDRVRVRIEKSG